MAERVLADCGIWIEGHDFAGVSNEVSLGFSADAPDKTNFKSGGWMDRAEGGLKSAEFSFGGFFDLQDEEQFASIGNERSVMVAPDGEDVGDPAYVVPVMNSGHALSGSIGELLAFSYAAMGDGTPFRAQVMDVRTGIDSDVDQGRQNFGVIPMGHTRKVFLHVTKNDGGHIRIDLMSASAMTGGTLSQRDMTMNIDETGLYELVAQQGMLNPINDQFWFLRYIVGGTDPDFDVAAAVISGEHQTIVPITPVTPAPPAPGTVSLRGGTNAGILPGASQLTIQGVNHVLTFPAFTNMRLLIARLSSQPDITSVILSSDPTRLNQFAGFTKFSTTVTVAGEHYNVWYSNQLLTFAAETDIEAT